LFLSIIKAKYELQNLSKLMKYLFLFTILLFILSGCASPKPHIHPNEHYEDVGKEQADKDVKKTVNEADDMGLNSKWKKHTVKTAVAAAAGGGVGAAVGAISGSLMVGSITGAAVALIGGVAAWIIDSMEPTEEYKYYVKDKLEKQGYKVTGWE
jgi:hypothetical protein